MAGVVFIICIPCEEHELQILRNRKNLSAQKSQHLKSFTELKPQNVSNNNSNSRTKLENYNSEDLRPLPASVEDLIGAQVNSEKCSMFKTLTTLLEELSIVNAIWNRANTGDYIQVTFSIESQDICEHILAILNENNIGRKFNSAVNVIPCNIHYNSNQKKDCAEDLSEKNEHDVDEIKTTAWNRFVSTVKSRLTVAQVVEIVRIRAKFSFDFMCLILISTSLCALGLVENSNVYLLSSMVISPMMGPVMAGTFGTVIQDKRLQKIGVQNELIGLGVATLVGFCYGSIVCLITDNYGTHDWPTYEITSRGELRSLWVGCLIALLSGAAVALGVLSDNIASLVGVAISTSLMPPAVNAGLLWSMSIVYYLKGHGATGYSHLSYKRLYSNNAALDLLALGAVSICLTLVNIICIYFSSLLVFKIKEVAPMNKDSAKKQFWKHDIKIARDYNKTIQGADGPDFFKNANVDFDKRINFHHSIDLTHDNLRINLPRNDYTWSPCMANLIRTSTMVKPEGSILNSSRRLSQIFNNMGDEPESLKNAKCKLAKSRKFTVTPCVCDPLLEK